MGIFTRFWPILAFVLAGPAFGQVPTPIPSATSTLSNNPVSIGSITGASASFTGNSIQGPQMFGGFVGPSPATGATFNPDGTFNNCLFNAGTPLACNTKRIYGSLVFTIKFTVQTQLNTSTGGAWYAIMGWEASGSTAPIQFAVVSGQPQVVGPLQYGSPASLSGTWGEMCTGFGGTTTSASGDACGYAAGDVGGDGQIIIALTQTPSQGFTTGYNTNISVSVLAPASPGTADALNIFNPTNDLGDAAFSSFRADAGDQEVEINTIVANGSCPTNGYAAARVFYWPDDDTGKTLAGFQNASYGAPLSADLPLDSNCNPTGNWVISGLTNNQGYFFDISVVDAAENNVFLLDPNVEGGAGAPCSTPPLNIFGPGATGTPGNDATCPFYATPSQVEGLLPNDLNCFIATAAYGSPFAPAVRTLRAFRNKFLYPYKLGRKFVKFYYRNSPFYAHLIAKNEYLRTVARFSLAPLWGFAWLSLHYSPLGVLLMLSSLLALIIVSMRRYRRGEW